MWPYIDGLDEVMHPSLSVTLVQLISKWERRKEEKMYDGNLQGISYRRAGIGYFQDFALPGDLFGHLSSPC